MPINVTMPRLSDTMEEGTLVSWKVGVGDQVSAGDHLADIETDKATMELQAFDDGKVARLVVGEGDTVPIETTILILAEDGEDVEQAAKADTGGGAKARPDDGDDDSDDDDTAEPASAGGDADKDEQEAEEAKPQNGDDTEGGNGDRKLRISPLARKLADEAGLDIKKIKGTGPDGRIIKRDILKAKESGGADQRKSAVPASAGTGTGTGKAMTPATTAAANERAVAAAAAGGPTLEARTVKLSQMRKTIAKRLVESKTTVPHFQVCVAVNMDPLLDLRKTLNSQLASQGIKLSVNDFVTRAIALAAAQHPDINSSWGGDVITFHGTVNVGVAISLPPENGGGLVVATVRDAHLKGLRQLSHEIKELAARAREGGLGLDEMADSTITISNLGMPQYGVTQFGAIINPPNAAIIAVGGAILKPVVRDGELTTGHEMNITLSGDHRVIDGAGAAEYLTTLRGMIENPASLLV